MRVRGTRLRIGSRPAIIVTKRKANSIIKKEIKKKKSILPAIIASSALLIGATAVGVYYLL